MNCEFEESEDSTIKICKRCKRKIRTPFSIDRIRAVCKKPGLGDRIVNGLTIFGIKKKRGCGCSSRQEKLNKWGAKIGL